MGGKAIADGRNFQQHAVWDVSRAFPAPLLRQQMEGLARREELLLFGASRFGLCWVSRGWQSWKRWGSQGWGKGDKCQGRGCQRNRKYVPKLLMMLWGFPLSKHFMAFSKARDQNCGFPPTCGFVHTRTEATLLHFVNLCKTFRIFTTFLVFLRQNKLKYTRAHHSVNCCHLCLPSGV